MTVPDPTAYDRGFASVQKGNTVSEQVTLPSPAGIVKFVEGLVAPFEKLASYFAIGGVGVADYPHLPTAIRGILAAAGAVVVALDRSTVAKASTPPAA
jgi:hypothetical protein